MCIVQLGTSSGFDARVRLVTQVRPGRSGVLGETNCLWFFVVVVVGVVVVIQYYCSMAGCNPLECFVRQSQL